MAVKQQVEKLEEKLESWASALNGSDSESAKKVGADIQTYLGRAFNDEFKGSLVKMLQQFDDRFRW